MLHTSPHDIEPALTDLVWPVLRAAQGWGVMHDATRVLVGLARHPGPIGALASVALAAGLSADRVDHRVLAVDAVAVLTASGRLTASGLASAMADFAPAARPGRWAGSLANLAQAHPGPFVPDLLTALLPAHPYDRRGGHALVDLLLEETIRLGGRVHDIGLRRWLEAVPGSGRGPAAARRVLAL